MVGIPIPSVKGFMEEKKLFFTRDILPTDMTNQTTFYNYTPSMVSDEQAAFAAAKAIMVEVIEVVNNGSNVFAQTILSCIFDTSFVRTLSTGSDSGNYQIRGGSIPLASKPNDIVSFYFQKLNANFRISSSYYDDYASSVNKWILRAYYV